MREALEWALGARGDFRTRGTMDGAYWWRGELAERAGLVWNGHRYVDALAAPTPTPPPAEREARAVPAVRRYFEMPPEARPREPLEKLRFFCSLAMTGQDWLDVEQFFDEVSAALAGAHEAGRREMRHEAAMAAWWLKQQYIGDPDDDGVVHWLSEAEAAIRALPAK